MPFVSQRARDNFQGNKLAELRSHCFYNQYDAETNPDGIVALAVAENKLMHPEIAEHITTNFKMTPYMLTYCEGPTGSSALRTALARFVNVEFHPSKPVNQKSICVTNGAGSAVDNLGFCVGEPGDGILVGRPLYVGFLPDLKAQAKIKPLLVSVGDADPTGVDAVAKYETALQEAEAQGIRVRAILLANPHNPLGRPYEAEALKGYLKLCSKYDIHLISDEVYVKSVFPSHDIPNPPPFLSVLSLDLEQFINPALVHVIYGMSKDFCANGVRIGAIISPFNPEILRAAKSVASFSRPSTMAEQAWLNLLQDEAFLEQYFPKFQNKMTAAYNYCTAVLKEHKIPYVPVSASSFIWLDLAEYLREDSLDAELEVAWKMADAGVWLAMGASFCSEKNGNFRVTFAAPETDVKLGMHRLITVLQKIKQEKADQTTPANGHV